MGSGKSKQKSSLPDPSPSSASAASISPSGGSPRGMIRRRSSDGSIVRSRNTRKKFLKNWEKQHKAIMKKIGDDVGSPEKLKIKLESTFKEIDTDASGKIDAQEMCKAMGDLGITMSEDELAGLINSFDLDGDKRISFQEWQQVIMEMLIEYRVTEPAPSASAKNSDDECVRVISASPEKDLGRQLDFSGKMPRRKSDVIRAQRSERRNSRRNSSIGLAGT